MMPASCWPPDNLFPQGVNVGLPTDQSRSSVIGDATWCSETSKNHFVATGLKMIGKSVAELVVAVFRGNVNVYTCARPVFKKTGAVVGNPIAEGGCSTNPFDWVRGGPDYYIVHFPAGINAGGAYPEQCRKVTWSATTASCVSATSTC